MFRILRRWWQRRKVPSENASAASEQGIEANQPSNEQAAGEWVAYDENLLERSRTQWQFGDWESLAAISRETLQHHPDRAKLALLAAAGHQQHGDMIKARKFVQLAQDWGESKRLISQILIAGVYNTLGRASALDEQQPRAFKHFENAVATANPNGDLRLFVQARTREELSRIENISNKRNSLPLIKSGNNIFFSSANYWEERYKNGGTSGYGSYGRLADFKAETINNFIIEKNIDEVIEFGCGDGNQLSKLKIKKYTGLDISETIINKCKEKFKNDSRKHFIMLNSFLEDPFHADLTLSLDVIYHLVEDEDFTNYINLLFDASEKYCIIYSSNEPSNNDDSQHIKRRKFTDWIEINKKDWELIRKIENTYPFKKLKNEIDSSISDFYFYQKTDKEL